MSQVISIPYIRKHETLIPGLDWIAQGGLPAQRTTLVAGSAGTGKTVLAVQFLAESIRKNGEGGVFVTLEEPAEEIRRNMEGFGWPISKWEDENKWAFVDASPPPGEELIISGSYDFAALMTRIEHAASKVKAKRVALDSLGAIFIQYHDDRTVRNELFRIVSVIRAMGLTAVLTAERTEEYGPISKHGVEEFVADNVIILRNVLEEEKRRRTLEILKFRGTNHEKGEYPYTILDKQGLIVIPLSAIELKQKSSDIRITSGVSELDAMCGGGFFRDSILLVSGATGTGKSLTATHFVAGGVEQKERCLLFAFEESRKQFFRNAQGWGMDFEQMEKDGLLRIVCEYPEVMGLEDHLIRMREHIREFNPSRIAIDSLSALERVGSIRSFREFVIGLTSFIKHQGIAGLFTSTTPTLLGGSSVTEAHISTITDLIILLRYAEVFGEMKRSMTVLKMRGSMHDKELREYRIDGSGMHIGRPFRNVVGILTGNPVHITPSSLESISEMFDEPKGP